MSGPKTSKYTLTPEQRKELEEQRRIERRKAFASESIKKAYTALHEIGSLYNGKEAIADELLSRIGDDGGFLKKHEQLCSLIASVEPIVSATDKSNVDSLENAEKSLSEKLRTAKQLSSEIEVIVANNDGKLHTKLANDIDKGLHVSFADIKSKDSEACDRIAAIKEKLLERKDILPAEYITEINSVLKRLTEISDQAFLKNYISLTVSPLLKKCDDFRCEYEEIHDEFDTLYTEYISLCGLYHLVQQEYTCSADAVKKLKAEIGRIKRLADEDDEQAYISKAVDEVMEEMGYTVIGKRDVTKKNGNHFHSELYNYSDGTAVNVTFASDGKIAMELGGLDSCDRLPEEHETDVLCEQMEKFCDDFGEIEKRLRQKGVIVADRISVLPPDAAYAQIINTSDFGLDGKIEGLTAERKSEKQPSKKAKEV